MRTEMGGQSDVHSAAPRRVEMRRPMRADTSAQDAQSHLPRYKMSAERKQRLEAQETGFSFDFTSVCIEK